MKIKKLLEAKFSKPDYAYHATMADHLESILKHGLIPNKSEGGYGSDEQSSIGYSLESLPGVYFTRSASQAKHIVDSLWGKGIIVITKLQYKDSELDEDSMTSDFIDNDKIKRSVSDIFDNFGYDGDNKWVETINKYLDETIETHTEIIEKDLIKKYSLDKRLLKNVHDDIFKYVKSIVDYLADSYMNQYLDDESDIKYYQNILTRKLKNIQHKNTQKFTTFKINKTIGFSGANRIVGFVSLDNQKGWGDIGDIPGNILKVKHPLQILEELEQ